MNEPMLDWRSIVEEAGRRRKTEQLTQRDLAALASVSVPTVVSFERGDIRLRMDKVFDILTALGMVTQAGEVGGQESFSHAAARRWNELVAPLADDDPARLPDGSVTYDYDFSDLIKHIPLQEVLPLLRKADEGETGWPPFWVATRDRIRPYNHDHTVECWQGIPEPDRSKDPSQADFWRVSPVGQAFLRRGLDEDGQSMLSPGSVFDITLPIWRTAEVLRHAQRLAKLWPGVVTRVRFRLRYRGLAGRELTSWAKPKARHRFLGTWRARGDEVTSVQTIGLDDLQKDFKPILSTLLAPVYAHFGGFIAPPEMIEDELADLIDAGRRKRDHRRNVDHPPM